MPTILTTSSHEVKCPNHGCPLDGIGFPMPRKGIGMCPVSGAEFAFEVETDELKMKDGVDKFGNKTRIADWKVEGND